ncbi:MAG: aminoacetone oxidase family FAD-binding enzyme [Alphaproteobacteria bacterium]|nr:MAG: aminoacetone oxidase family FAD-binding enzyme [Alphaproteobacteria bacterium]
MNNTVAVIGAGPAGLMAAEVLSAAGKRVVVYDRMPSVGRKFLMAGRGGLNLTHSEPLDQFVRRYGAASERMRPLLEAFTPADLIAWANGLGQGTFVGSSGRVFPKAMKASPLLRAWLARLSAQGVEVRTRMRWLGWDENGALKFQHDDGHSESLTPAATILALGGASWPRLGSDGAWAETLRARGISLTPFQPSNVGYNVAWSDHFRARFAGEPLKNIAIRFGDKSVRGEAIVTTYGLEGGALYALSANLREQSGPARIHIDLRPTHTLADLTAKLLHTRPGDSLSNTLRKSIGLTPVAINLLREANGGALSHDPTQLAAFIKAAPLTLTAPRGLERAISTAGGVAWESVTPDLELKAAPRVYAAGEMLDWEAPTGGYLLQGCFATGVCAARAVLRRASGLEALGPR